MISMSSRIVRPDDAKDVAAFSWTAAKVPPKAGVPLGEAIAPDPVVQANAAWEQRLRQLQGECEVRVQQALQAGRAEADESYKREHAAKLETLYRKLATAASELADLRDKLRKEAESDVVRLALAIARKVIHREVAVDSELLVGLVHSILQKIDTRELHQLRVHPDQVEGLVRAWNRIYAPKKVEIVPDRSLEPGAALFETTRGVLDASVDTQLGEIERGMLDLTRRLLP